MGLVEKIKAGLRLVFSDCTCGSGAHPRECKRHPWALQDHVALINHEILCDTVEELEKRVEALERKNL